MTDFNQIAGQEAAKRAMIVALAGKHSIHLIGPPGVGKSMLIAAARCIDSEFRAIESWPCPCGYRISPQKQCRCSIESIERHLRRKAPADVTVEVPDVPWREFEFHFSGHSGTGSEDVRRQISAAGPRMVRNCLEESSVTILKAAYTEMGMSPRDASSVIRVAESIARLEQKGEIEASHISEAINYRPLMYFSSLN